MVRKAVPLLVLYILFFVLTSVNGQDRRGLRVVQEAVINDLPHNQGKRIAICIGVNSYQDESITDLEKAANDALGMVKVLSGPGQFDSIYTFINTNAGENLQDRQIEAPAVQTNRKPATSDILRLLEDLKSELQPEDLIVFSFSGHGVSNNAGEGFLLCSDTSYQDLFESSLPVSTIVDWVEASGVQKSVFFIDACREQVSEYQSRGLGRGRLESTAYSQARVSATFYATRTGWYSFEDINSNYGIFTRFVLDAITGSADFQGGNQDGLVTFSELAGFVDQGVSQYTASLGLKQKPALIFNGSTLGDLAISAYSGSIEVSTRSLIDREEQTDWGTGRAAVHIFSNVGGQLYIDDEAVGRIKAGEVFEIERVRPGPHFLKLEHDFGTFRSDASVHGGEERMLVNQHLEQKASMRIIEGINFVFVPHEDYPGKGFWMSETEITLGAFSEFINDTGYDTDGNWNAYYRTNYDWFPVSDVSLRDAMAYSQWFNDYSGYDVRLPTAEEWAWAAGENHDRSYPWGNSWNAELTHSAHSESSGMLPVQGERGPVQVMYSFRDISLEGISSLSGNLREWCLEEADITDSETGILSGGSWTLKKGQYFKAAYKSRKNDYYHSEDTGIRLILLDP